MRRLFLVLFIAFLLVSCAPTNLKIDDVIFCTAYGPGARAGMELGNYFFYTFATSDTILYEVEKIQIKDDGTDIFAKLIENKITTNTNFNIKLTKQVDQDVLKFKRCINTKENSNEQILLFFEERLV